LPPWSYGAQTGEVGGFTAAEIADEPVDDALKIFAAPKHKVIDSDPDCISGT